MHILTTKNRIETLSELSLILSISFRQAVNATEIEKVCKDPVKNKIAWDLNSGSANTSKWEQVNLESLS